MMLLPACNPPITLIARQGKAQAHLTSEGGLAARVACKGLAPGWLALHHRLGAAAPGAALAAGRRRGLAGCAIVGRLIGQEAVGGRGVACMRRRGVVVEVGWGRRAGGGMRMPAPVGASSRGVEA